MKCLLPLRSMHGGYCARETVLGIARALAEAGSTIVLNGARGPIAGAGGPRLVRKRFRNGGELSPADMTKHDEISRMIAHIVEEHGRLDILVDNPGIQHVAPLMNFRRKNGMRSLRSIFRVHCIRAAVPAIVSRSGFGRIINIASAHALVGSPFKAAYVAAKHGILGLARSRRGRDGGGRHHLQRGLPRVCLHAACRGADRGVGEAHNIPHRASPSAMFCSPSSPNKRSATGQS